MRRPSPISFRAVLLSIPNGRSRGSYALMRCIVQERCVVNDGDSLGVVPEIHVLENRGDRGFNCGRPK